LRSSVDAASYLTNKWELILALELDQVQILELHHCPLQQALEKKMNDEITIDSL
jgi:hypothetical protein